MRPSDTIDPAEIILSFDEAVIYTGLSREQLRHILRRKLRESTRRISVIEADECIAWHRRWQQRQGIQKYGA